MSGIRESGTRFTALVLVGLVLGLGGCGGDEASVTNQRGMGGKKLDTGASTKAAGGGTRRSAQAPGGTGEEAPAEDPEFEKPKRPELTGEDFSVRARDPFHNYLAAEVVEAPVAVEVVRKERDVKLSEYTFEELKLIAIVNAGRSVAPRALFLSSDNKSKSVKQGEYFSSAEVLLASVNRDYIEVEVVDPELTPGWNLERGERKVIYLKQE